MLFPAFPYTWLAVRVYLIKSPRCQVVSNKLFHSMLPSCADRAERCVVFYMRVWVVKWSCSVTTGWLERESGEKQNCSTASLSEPGRRGVGDCKEWNTTVPRRYPRICCVAIQSSELSAVTNDVWNVLDRVGGKEVKTKLFHSILLLVSVLEQLLCYDEDVGDWKVIAIEWNTAVISRGTCYDESRLETLHLTQVLVWYGKKVVRGQWDQTWFHADFYLVVISDLPVVMDDVWNVLLRRLWLGV